MMRSAVRAVSVHDKTEYYTDTVLHYINHCSMTTSTKYMIIRMCINRP